MNVVLHDDAVARGFEPFSLTRPISTLVSGTLPIFARWERMGLTPTGFLAAEHLADFDEGLEASHELPSGTIVANSRFAPALDASMDDADGVWTSAGRVVAVRLTRGLRAADLRAGSIPLELIAAPDARMREIQGWWHDEVWDFLRLLPTVLAADIVTMGNRKDATPIRSSEHVRVLGSHPVIECGATIDPFVVLDASGGPILIEAGATIHSFTRINGPCYIGPNAIIMGGDISGCSFGPVSKIRGEISGSIVLGYSNKGHEGFVGNSYLGRWVNLGAGTTTSNLKNTYGQVALWTPTGIRPTGMQFLGTMFGDHVKTGIGTTLTTGTVLGAGANVFGSQMPPKAVAPFSWGEGEPYDLYAIDKFLVTAETVMGRRKLQMSEGMKRQLTASFEKRWSAK
ncbi:MAG: putative sugar nucleotidyl transferase [Gemmatimonadaceae bacterium]